MIANRIWFGLGCLDFIATFSSLKLMLVFSAGGLSDRATKIRSYIADTTRMPFLGYAAVLVGALAYLSFGWLGIVALMVKAYHISAVSGTMYMSWGLYEWASLLSYASQIAGAYNMSRMLEQRCLQLFCSSTGCKVEGSVRQHIAKDLLFADCVARFGVLWTICVAMSWSAEKWERVLLIYEEQAPGKGELDQAVAG